MAGDERIRLFCALQLPEDVLERVVDWQRERLEPHADRLRPVARGNLHVTLAFLGARGAADVPVVTAALREAALAAGPVELRPARYRETRGVGMIACDDVSGAGAALAADLGGRLEQAGVYRRETRPWLAHVTVARFREPPRLRFESVPEGNICSVRCALYRSLLGSAGSTRPAAVYDVLASVALGGR